MEIFHKSDIPYRKVLRTIWSKSCCIILHIFWEILEQMKLSFYMHLYIYYEDSRRPLMRHKKFVFLIWGHVWCENESENRFDEFRWHISHILRENQVFFEPTTGYGEIKNFFLIFVEKWHNIVTKMMPPLKTNSMFVHVCWKGIIFHLWTKLK